jgi:hypothetical protein
MNRIIFSIPVRKNNFDETRDFYINKLGFTKFEDESIGMFFVNIDYPCAAIRLVQKKKSTQQEDVFLSFRLEKNLPSYCRNLQKIGINVELVASRFQTSFSASFNDPADNLIIVHCDTVEDDSGETFEFLIAD